nr:hypothetical protein [Roseibium sp. RKSG952]
MLMPFALAGNEGIEGFDAMNLTTFRQCRQSAVYRGWRDIFMRLAQGFQNIIGRDRTVASPKNI